MDKHNINSDSGLTGAIHIDGYDANSNNKKDNANFNGKTVSEVPAIPHDEYLLDDEFGNGILNRIIKASEEDVAMPSVKEASNYKLTDSQINKKVKKMIKSCEHGRSIVIYYANAQTSAMLLWDPIKKKPVYTTFNQQGVVVDSSSSLNALREDMQMYSDSRYENKEVKLKGLNTQAAFSKMKESNNHIFHKQNNNSAQYISGLLKASLPHEYFAIDTAEKMSIDSNNLLQEIKQSIKKKGKEVSSKKQGVGNNKQAVSNNYEKKHIWDGNTKIHCQNGNRVKLEDKAELLSLKRNGYLCSSIDILNNVNTSDQAREALTALFESESSRKLFVKNNYSVSKKGVLEFVKRYKNAIILESKQTQARNASHQIKRENKKYERLLAINEIEHFVNELNSSDPDFENKCRLSLQMLGRIREPSCVDQGGMGLCGGFAAIQLGWREKPLRLARMCLELARSNNRSVSVPTSVPKCKVTFKINSKVNLNNYKGPNADLLLIAAIYGLEQSGTNSDQDAMILTYLGVEPLTFKKELEHYGKHFIMRLLYLDELCKASKQGGRFIMSINGGDLPQIIDKLGMNTKHARKYNKKKIIDVEVSKNLKTSKTPHAIIVDGIKRVEKNGKKYVALKIHSYGERLNLIMKEESFLDHTIMEHIIVVKGGVDTDYSTFKASGNEAKSGRYHQFTICRNGKKYYNGR